MSTSKKLPDGRTRGVIQGLPSGALRARLYAGVDPLTGKRIYLTETIPANHPDRDKEAKRALTRLLTQVDERRAARTRASVNKLMDRYLERLDVEVTTRVGYEGYIRNHIRPLLGHLEVGKLDAETIDSFYSILRTCRAHCGGKRKVDHHTADEHVCDTRCKKHKCRPLAASSIRQIHWCLSGALSRALRWKWITVNPLDQTEVPRGTASNPEPPTAEQAAAIVNEAFKDLDWGVLVWLAMTTGVRRGEIAAIRLDRLDLEKGVLWLRTSIAQRNAETWEKDVKTHQQRRIALDSDTVGILRAYLAVRAEDASKVGMKISKRGRLFSPSVDHAEWINPSTITQRYRRMCARLGWDMHIHQLRHYSATELIAAGVDVRTVAGRLGHGGGGSTTLRVYSAWVSEADQRAAGSLASHMPKPPMNFDADTPVIVATAPSDHDPYHQIAGDLRGAIMVGAYKTGEPIPTLAEIAKRYHVAASTVHRAVKLLQDDGLLTRGKGNRLVVLDPTAAESGSAEVIPIKAKRKAK
jgi:integrase/DNA-binding transcriptional regulator YhcF (GntR family)